MGMFKVKNKKVEEVSLLPFKLEKEIQNLVEENTAIFFDLEFISSELTVGKYRIDTLCFDDENNSFVIIEYKKGSSYSVIDQGYTYLQLLLNNKSDFLLVLSQHLNKVLKLEDVDWSQSKIIFVSPSFNSYQKDSVNFQGLPFELWEVKRYSNDVVAFNQHRSNSKESIETLNPNNTNSLISEVTKEIRVYTMDQHLSKFSIAIKTFWESLTIHLNELPGTELIPKRHYIGLVLDGKTVCYLKTRKNDILMDTIAGTVSNETSYSKNYFILDDPKKTAKMQSRNWSDSTKQLSYRVRIEANTDIDYLMFLIKQKYNSLSK